MPYRSMLDNFLSSQRPLFSLSNRVWNPPTDIYDCTHKTVIRMEVAGLDESRLEVIAQRNMLVIRGRRAQLQDQADQAKNYHLMEIHYGDFERVFAFSFTLNQERVKAAYEKGFIIIEVQHQEPTVTLVSVEIVDPSSSQP